MATVSSNAKPQSNIGEVAEDRFTVVVNDNAENVGSVIDALAELLVDLWEDEQRAKG